jgi:transcriptional regulator with XRE-family HTH domain
MNQDERQLFETIGQRLRERRLAIDVKQADLAKRLGLSRSSLANIEAGRQRIPLYTLYRICVELDIDVTALLPSLDEVLSRTAVTFTREAAPPKTRAFIDGLLGEE